MTKYIFFAGGMEEGNRDMKIRSTAVMSTSALTWRSSCPGVFCRNSSELLPYGIYTIPEISIMGKMKAQLTEAKIPYEIGIARYEEMAKGSWAMALDYRKYFSIPERYECWGVHVIGENAAEIVHIGQAVLSLGATIEYFRDTVFNYPLWRKPTRWRP
jgi:pyruvate/2-oxoglutarate dehydrogenase complex dihydrolipoamide dehydrogenase (E3) component